MTIHLPPHRVERLAKVLASIPITQMRTSGKKWHNVLGKLRSMALALPDAHNLFSQMQHALTSKIKTQLALNNGGPPGVRQLPMAAWRHVITNNQNYRACPVVLLSGGAPRRLRKGRKGRLDPRYPPHAPRRGFKLAIGVAPTLSRTYFQSPHHQSKPGRNDH